MRRNGSMSCCPDPQFWIALLHVGMMKDLERWGIPPWENLQSWGEGPSKLLLTIKPPGWEWGSGLSCQQPGSCKRWEISMKVQPRPYRWGSHSYAPNRRWWSAHIPVRSTPHRPGPIAGAQSDVLTHVVSMARVMEAGRRNSVRECGGQRWKGEGGF